MTSTATVRPEPVEGLITQHLGLWSAAIKRRSTAGRGSSSKIELYGVKKLRELILELAVRGLLVPQDPKDEPASELLKRIAAEKAKLVKAGKIKKETLLPALSSEEETLFAVPQGWALTRLANVINVLNGRAYKKHEMLSEGTPILRVGNLFTSNEWCFSDLELDPEKYINDGDLIYAWSASFGPFIWQGGKVIYHYHIWKMDFISKADVDKFYFRHYLQAISAAIKESGNGIAMIHMTKERMEKLVLPIPPLAEQHRIVAKVDELMALCDQLEQQTNASLSAHETLVATLLKTLTSAADHAQFASSWRRIAEHFDALFTTEESIDQLKQTILQLAVMGKLVPQDPNDEPASELLKRIAIEKAKLVKAGKIKKEKPLQPIDEGEACFSLARGWARCRLEDVSLHSDAGWSPKCEEIPRRGNDWGILKVSAVTWGVFNPAENKALPPNLDPVPAYEVKAGDFLISRANTAELVARSVVVGDDAPPRLMMSDKIIRFSFSREVLPLYLSLFNNSLGSRRYYLQVAGGTSSSMKNVSRLQIQSLAVSIPPLAEQHRIVAKVDELMAMCDQLKFRLTAAQIGQLHLADALAEKALAKD